jgi:hypothetical protein
MLALYQAGVLMFFRQLLVRPDMPLLTAYLAMYHSLFLGILTGYLVGLFISAIAPNQNVAVALVVVVLALQVLFAGAFFPMDAIPGEKQISVVMPTRWTFESFVRITGLGDQLAADPCWTIFNPEDRMRLPDEMVERCSCLGASIFTACTDFPGILSPAVYDETAQAAMELPAPLEPMQPTKIPPPTVISSPTPLPTPTLAPSLTPYPTPRFSTGISEYLQRVQEQEDEYQQIVADQFEQYRLDSLAQHEDFLLSLSDQTDAYLAANQDQADQFANALQAYGDELAGWQKDREPAIKRAEALLSSIFDNFRQVFLGSVLERWLFLGLIQFGLLILLTIALRFKDMI